MELFESLDLKSILFDEMKSAKYLLTEEVKIVIAFKICRTIWYLHYKGVIHRDIKPGNILMNERYEIKVCDFGLSKVNAMATSLLTTTGKKTSPGTPMYMAPQLLLDQEEANFFSDMWSLGCVVNEIFVRQITWDKKMNDNFIHTILRNKCKPNLTSVPEFLRDLLSRCFDYDATNRSSAQELTECLKSKIDDMQIKL